MSIRKYEAFAKVVELGSLTHASQALGLTQSGVSHMIAGLEGELKLKLLVRSRAGVQLTEEGAAVLPIVRNILNGVEQLNQTAASLRGLDAGIVRIGAFTSVAVHWLPGMIKQFRADYPNIEFKLLNGDYHDVEQWLREGSIDLGFVALPLELKCRCIPLLNDRLMAILPPEHPMAGADAFPVQKVAEEDFITLLETSDHDARRVLEPNGVKANVKYTTKDDYAIIAMVENGLGMSIMPELLLNGHTERIAVLPLDPPACRTIALAIPESSAGSLAAAKFADCAQHWLQEQSSHGRDI